jgi:Ras-related protein Rab-18
VLLNLSIFFVIFFIVYDVSNRDTFDALNTWWNEVNTYCSSPDVVKMIVGNKVDKVNI